MWILNPTQEDTFVPYFMQIGRAIASINSPEKKEQKKANQRKNKILPFYKNGNIIKIIKATVMDVMIEQ